jgi:two-component system response regulator GlrR
MPTPPSWVDAEMDGLARRTILLVEDDADIRELLVTWFRIAGYSPVACGSAEEGLERLREQQVDLVVTDYMLPNRSGAWMLSQASEEGLLGTTPALVVTAHPNPHGAEGFEVIHKPFDLDQLVHRVKWRLENGSPSAPRRPGRSSRAGGRNGHDGDDDCPDPIELILYVSAHSPRSAAAIENIRAALSRYNSSRVRLTICDLATDPHTGTAEAVAFAPTLVTRSPGPRTFILGHITNPELLIELLVGCEDSTK